MKLVRSLVWTVVTYGAEGWTLKKAESVGLNTEQTTVSSQSLPPPDSF